MRLFYALWPDIKVREQVKTISNQLNCGKIVPSENLHLTLVFLGQVNEDKKNSLVMGTNEIVGKKFLLELTRFGSFRRSGIFWVAPSIIPGELINLVNKLTELAVSNQIFVDVRPYRPHVTLARSTRERVSPNSVSISWPVTKFSLIESKTLPGGAEYQVLQSWPLT